MSRDQTVHSQVHRRRPWRKPVRWGFEYLERRCLLAAVPFSEQPIISGGLADTADALAADIDGDSDADYILISDGGVAWFENLGDGQFAEQPSTYPNFGIIFSRDLDTADLDGDGDLDFVVGSVQGLQSVYWYQNTDGRGTLDGPRQIASQEEILGVDLLDVSDLDGDGYPDVVVAARFNGLLWFRNDGQGDFSAPIEIDTGIDQPISVRAEDMDGDGDNDIVALSSPYDVDGELVWYENTNGRGRFDAVQFEPVGFAPAFLDVGDLDGDGDPDVTYGSGYSAKIAWLENLDGDGTLSAEQQVSDISANTVLIVDIDNDQDNDLIGATGQMGAPLQFIENLGDGVFDTAVTFGPSTSPPLLGLVPGDMNGDGLVDLLTTAPSAGQAFLHINSADGTLQTVQISPNSVLAPEAVRIGDLDGDGDNDVLAMSGDRELSWFANEDGLGTFGPELTVLRFPDAFLPGVQLADLDGDQDIDIAYADDIGPTVAWVENSSTGFLRVHESDFANTGPWKLVVADLDGDGDPDLLTSNLVTMSTVWLENVDGRGTFEQRLIRSGDEFAEIAPADFDGDGDLDLALGVATGISWHRNTDGQGTFDEDGLLNLQYEDMIALHAEDFDGDGDVDILARVVVANEGPRAYLFDNADGRGGFSQPRPVDVYAGGPTLTYDVDQDGDVDLVTSPPGSMRWHENVGGDFSVTRLVGQNILSVGGLAADDINGDGLLDIVASLASQNALVWFRNDSARVSGGDLDGDGDVDALDIDVVAVAIRDSRAEARFDLNGDGSVDDRDRVYLVTEILDTVIGDVNLDGLFDRLDLVLILQAGHYKDGQVANSGWATGDWNGDGEFDQLDILAALQAGSYRA